MKRRSVLVNTARGEVVDEEGMRRGLEDGRVRVTCRFVHTTMLTVMTAVFFSSRSVDLPQLTSVGLDVYPDKPQVKPRLLAFPQKMCYCRTSGFARTTQNESWSYVQ